MSRLVTVGVALVLLAGACDALGSSNTPSESTVATVAVTDPPSTEIFNTSPPMTPPSTAAPSNKLGSGGGSSSSGSSRSSKNNTPVSGSGSGDDVCAEAIDACEAGEYDCYDLADECGDPSIADDYYNG